MSDEVKEVTVVLQKEEDGVVSLWGTFPDGCKAEKALKKEFGRNSLGTPYFHSVKDNPVLAEEVDSDQDWDAIITDFRAEQPVWGYIITDRLQ